MRKQMQRALARLSRLHRDESGEQNMSTVMLLGVGALVVVGLIAIGVFIFNYAKGNMEKADIGKEFPTPQ